MYHSLLILMGFTYDTHAHTHIPPHTHTHTHTHSMSYRIGTT